jgi:hypothetical protein
MDGAIDTGAKAPGGCDKDFQTAHGSAIDEPVLKDKDLPRPISTVAARRLAGMVLAGLLLASCQDNPLTVKRSPCPAAAIPNYVGSVTRFNPPESRNADAIDFVAQIIDIRPDCIDSPDAAMLVTNLAFKVSAQRREQPGRGLPARDVTLPLFVAMVQGGNVLVAKQETSITLRFEEGKLRAVADGQVRADVARAATTPPPEVVEKITRKRKANEPDALVDPMSDPLVRAAVRAASFEVLLGFQLDDASLAYNVAR